MTATVPATELEYVDPRANSAKFYRVYDLGGAVTTQYGRIGTYGTFTSRKPAVDSAAAADKAIAGKLAKGYDVVRAGVLVFPDTPDDSDLDAGCARLARGAGARMPADRDQSPIVVDANQADVDPDALAKVTAALAHVRPPRAVPAPTQPTRPMLAQEQRDGHAIARLIAHAGWAAQYKLDGDRVVIEVVDGTVAVLNRAGQPKVKNVSDAMLAPFRDLTDGRWVFDGEVVDRTLHLFDMPAAGPFHDETDPFATRFEDLCIVADVLGFDAAVAVAYTAWDPEAKAVLHAAAVADGKEGVILRDVDGLYEHGKRSAGLIKHKFLNTADCVVTEVGVKGKESVALSVYDDAGLERLVGHAPTIGKTPAPRKGDVWEVRFLYVVSAVHPTMVQARLVRKRTDKAPAECSLAQFVGAVTDKTVA